MVLTEEQTQKIRRNRKEVRPKYFNADLGEEVIISENFESFLILLDDGVKQNTISQLQKSIKNNNVRKDRDELLNRALSSELSDSQSIYTEVNSEFSSFDSFVASFKLEGFEAISEVGLLITDIQSALGERLLLRDRMEHLNILIKVVTNSLSPETVKETKIKELNSWIKVITSYKGLK